MARNKYYAWISPQGAGIFDNWDECQKACAGQRKEKHKGFATYEEAWKFAYPDTPMPSFTEDEPEQNIIDDSTVLQEETFTPAAGKETVSESVRKYCQNYGFSHLSEDQMRAVQSVSGKTLLFAVPGSGKTTVIIARTGFMVFSCGIKPREIMSLTFTKAAANEMKTRYQKHFSTDVVPDFRTIHSLCYSIILPKLRQLGFEFPHDLIGEESEEEDEKTKKTPSVIYRALFKELKCHISDYDTAVEAAQCVITGIKNSVMQRPQYAEKKIKIDNNEITAGRLFDSYQAILKSLDCMDYDDLLIYAYKGLKKYKTVLSDIQNRYKYWSVDEAQDNSKLQFMLLELICGDDGNLFMVGDDDQSIYSFRGANPQMLLQFGHKSNVKTLLMGYNYRSDYEIVDTSKAFIESNVRRADKEMKAYSANPGFIFIPRTLKTEAEQYAYITSAAKEAISSGTTLAVLFRRNISIFPLLVYFHRNGIKYEANKGLSEILRSKHVKVVWKIFSFIVNPHNMKAFLACNNYLGLYLSKEEQENLSEAHKKLPNADILELLLNKYEEADNNEKAEEVKRVSEELSALSKMQPSKAVITIFSKIYFLTADTIGDRLRVYSLLSACDCYPSISAFVSDMHVILAEEKKAVPDDNDPVDIDGSTDSVATDESPLVTLSSMHSAKGREFDRVIIIDTFDEIMPGEARTDALIYDSEEELRLFYVAVTRAAHRLDLLTVDKYHGNVEIISRFVTGFAFLCDSEKNASILEGINDGESVHSETYKIEPQKYYAVKKGRQCGLFTSWRDAQAQVNGYPGQEYRSFSSKEEAEAYLGIASESDGLPPINMDAIDSVLVGSGGVAFNYPMDLPSQITEAVYKRFDCKSSLTELSTERIRILSQQTNGIYCSAGATDYSACTEGYLLTYMPVNYYKVWKPLSELAKRKKLPIDCKILELGAGPGTATLGLISFYKEIALSTPETNFSIDITAVEREKNFEPLFTLLTDALTVEIPKNLHVAIRFIQGDALVGNIRYTKQYGLIVESNMLNASEDISDAASSLFVKVIKEALANHGTVICIEPGKKEDQKYLCKLAANIEHTTDAKPLMRPSIQATDITAITLYNDTVAAGLRGAKKKEHWFSYLIMEKEVS